MISNNQIHFILIKIQTENNFYCLRKKMSNKLALLRSKIGEMQREIQQIERGPSISPKKSIQTNNCSSKNRNIQSPTFWGTNPITNDTKYSPKRVQKTASPSRHQSIRNISPRARMISAAVDQKFYTSVVERQSQSPQWAEPKCFSPKKRFQYSFHGLSRGLSPKNQKIKTFSPRITDTIINPEKQKSIGRKIVNRPQRSPPKLFIEHPGSKQNLYCYSSKPIVYMPRRYLQDKNHSCFSLAHEPEPASEEGNQWQKRKKSNRKHFGRYFQETLISQFD